MAIDRLKLDTPEGLILKFEATAEGLNVWPIDCLIYRENCPFGGPATLTREQRQALLRWLQMVEKSEGESGGEEPSKD